MMQRKSTSSLGFSKAIGSVKPNPEFFRGLKTDFPIRTKLMFVCQVAGAASGRRLSRLIQRPPDRTLISLRGLLTAQKFSKGLKVRPCRKQTVYLERVCLKRTETELWRKDDPRKQWSPFLVLEHPLLYTICPSH